MHKYLKDPSGRLHFFSAEDVERGRVWVPNPIIDPPIPLRDEAGEQRRDEVGEPLTEAAPLREPVEGPNRIWSLVPDGSVEITDEEAYAIEHPPETMQQAAVRLQSMVQGHMDAAARELGYDDIKTAVTYADEPAVATFQAQGQAFRSWRSRVWAACYSMLADAEAAGEIPSDADVLAALPSLEMPA
ncbi:hypothetical protein ACO2Q9_02935 [Variovorax sp. VNK109]|uniref:hypothetical protein n=1 Tax=Variovorax sp. VNK109 TaxID=3400919 RepID=UPI003C07E652